MTTTIKSIAIKTLALLVTMSLIISCSNNNTTKADKTPKNAVADAKSTESITVNGTVKSVSYGKDGYIADVQTESGNYAALVSIVNVGGRENYKSCEIGDTVIFKGVPSQLGDVQQLTVKEIISITAAPATSVQDLMAKYSKITTNDYCWQINKVLNLHAKPSSDSKVEGKHFAGEVLTVLGTKLFGNQLWVNVKYNLKVKTGYEDQFADGQVTPTGSPTGWIGGAETPKINCK
jgi:RecG-like helicase